MPSKHRYPQITPRLPAELKIRAQRAVEEKNTDLSSLITTLLRWYVGDLHELPERPVSGPNAESEQGMPQVECKLCRVELLRHPSYARRSIHPITSYMHPLDKFPRAYGHSVDTGHDIRADNCGRYGVNTGAKLAEHHVPFGWIDEITGERLCSNEDPERRGTCDRLRFHEGDHRDSTAHRWHQRDHFLLTRAASNASALKHAELYDTRTSAEEAAFFDSGRKEMSWTPLQGSMHYLGTISDQLAYVITYIDVSNVQEWLASVPNMLASATP